MGIANNTSIVRDGLVLHIDAANPKCFSSGQTTCENMITGGLLTGASGTPGTGVHTPNSLNFPSYNPIYNGVFDFAGGRGMNAEENLGYYTSLAMDIWFYKNGSGQEYITDARNDGGLWFISNFLNYNIKYPEAATYNFDTAYNGSNPDFINQWHHMVLNSNSFGSELYIDGTERILISNSSIVENLGVNFRIGTRYTTANEWTGFMGPIKIYNRILTPSEVIQNFLAHRGRYGI